MATLASPWLRPCTVFVNAALSEMLARGSTETRQLQRLMTKTAAASGKTAAAAASDVYAGTEYTKERNYDDGKATEMRAGGGGSRRTATAFRPCPVVFRRRCSVRHVPVPHFPSPATATAAAAVKTQRRRFLILIRSSRDIQQAKPRQRAALW